MLSAEVPLVSQHILEVIPLVMRTIAFELRQTEHVIETPHFRLMWMLNHRSFTLSELADHQAVSLPTMSNSITILEDRGWVSRVRSDFDRRKVLIELSPAGHDVLDQVQRQAEQRVAEHLLRLTDLERQTLLAGLSVLRSAFASPENCVLSKTPDS
jgi:DNA-binding MarR family transcriptional regulator